MKTTLSMLLYTDTAGRWSILYWAMATTTIVGFVGEEFLGLSLPVCTMFAVAAGLGAGLISVRRYLGRTVIGKARKALDTGFGRGLGYAAVSLALIAAVSLTSTRLQASIINFRLKRVLQSPPSAKKALETKKILAFAKKSNVAIVPELLSQASSSLAAGDASGADAIDGKTWSEILAESNQALADTGIAFLDGTVSYMWVEGQHSQELDRFNAIGASFTGTPLVYRGGPLHLEKANFSGNLIAVADNENGRRLVEAIVKARGRGVDIDLH